MNKKLLFSVLILILSIPLLYTTCWFVITNRIISNLNNNYAGEEINISAVEKDKYNVRIAKFSASGFPFKLKINLIEFTEEGQSTRALFKQPIVVGYDLLKQKLSISYSGEIINQYKPLESGFGSKIKIDDYRITTHIGLNYKLYKALSTNSFEIINFIEELKLSKQNLVITDLVDAKEIYNQPFEQMKIKLSKPKDYTNWHDVLINIPNQAEIDYEVKINKSEVHKKHMPGNMLIGFTWPAVFTAEAKLNITTNAKAIHDLRNNWHLNVVKLKTTSRMHESESSFSYNVKGNDINFSTNSDVFIKQGFFLNALEFVDNILALVPKIPALIIAKNEIDYVIKNSLDFDFKNLENRKYNNKIRIDINLLKRNDKLVKFNSNIKEFSLTSAKTGIVLNDQSTVDSNKSQYLSKGVLALYNYEKLIDMLMNNNYKFLSYSRDSQYKQLYNTAIKYFLRSISDYPKSKAPDITIEYAIDSNNIENTKIGTIGLTKLKILYYLALYKIGGDKFKFDETILRQLNDIIPQIRIEKNIIDKILPQAREKGSKIIQKLLSN